MALEWKCDRCGLHDDYQGDDDTIPDDWRNVSVPVRGSQGARSVMDALICAACDDSLYDWFHRGTPGERNEP